jgi:hypothetical protein
VALAAGIFSMQQAVIPFEQTPRSFGITVFIIMIVVSLTQFFGIHVLPSLRKKLASTRKTISCWIERGEREEVHRIMAGAELKNEDEPVRDVGQGRTPTDEERVTPKTSTVKTRTWMSWVTGTTIE